MHVHTVEGRTVLEVIVPPGKQKPYYAKDHDNRWWAYIRILDELIEPYFDGQQFLFRQNEKSS